MGAAAWRASWGAHWCEGPDPSLRGLGAPGDGHGPYHPPQHLRHPLPNEPKATN